MTAARSRWIWGDIDRGPFELMNDCRAVTIDMGDIDRGHLERVNGCGAGAID